MKLVETSSLPAVTLILFSYNQAEFVSQAAISCFNQDYAGPLEILLSDDFSTDDTFYILKNLTQEYGGPHLVRLRQNSFNQGIGEHYNTAIAEADGDLIFTAAGDDISLPFRVRLVVDAWLANGCRADLISSNLQQIDEQGVPGKIITVSDLGRWKTPVEWLRKRP
jgi:glycosyltransferase involved in cell wall biosynthesis